MAFKIPILQVGHLLLEEVNVMLYLFDIACFC